MDIAITIKKEQIKNIYTKIPTQLSICIIKNKTPSYSISEAINVHSLANHYIVVYQESRRKALISGLVPDASVAGPTVALGFL